MRWQYGLGRAAVFTSDAKELVGRELGGVGRLRYFLGERDARPAAKIAQRPRPPRDTTVLKARSLSSYRWERQHALRPSGHRFQSFMSWGRPSCKKSSRWSSKRRGSYEARVSAGERYGLFRIRPSSALEHFPEVAFYRENAELNEYGSNPERCCARLPPGRAGSSTPSRKTSSPVGRRFPPRWACGRACSRWLSCST